MALVRRGRRFTAVTLRVAVAILALGFTSARPFSWQAAVVHSVGKFIPVVNYGPTRGQVEASLATVFILADLMALQVGGHRCTGLIAVASPKRLVLKIRISGKHVTV